MYISDNVKYVGVDDKDIDLFESQYVVNNGVTYNSYIIFDEKIVIMDTVDKRKTVEWLSNIERELNGRKPDYLVISHMEPDHSASIIDLLEKYPELILIGNAKTFQIFKQFNCEEKEYKCIVVKEADEIAIGECTLQFFMAPMVHWPEVMVTYEKKNKILFSADGFGTFGTLQSNLEWIKEARRYYINIVGKYGKQVQMLLNKASKLDIQIICPLHGPVLTTNLSYYIEKYSVWSSYKAEEAGVLVAYASIHGNTADAAKKISELLKKRDIENVVTMDLSRDDMSVIVEKAFQYDKLIVASATYDAGLFPVMEDFLNHLLCKNYQNRKVGIVENGSWAPVAGKKMKETFGNMKNIEICNSMVSILSVANNKNLEQMEQLVDEIIR